VNSPFGELVCTRKSIRRYKSEIPPDAWITDMVQCAIRAPSPSNRQPVRIFRLCSPEIREHLKLAVISGRDRLLEKLKTEGGPKKLKNRINTYFRYSQFLFDAPLVFAFGTGPQEDGFSRRLSEAGLITDFRGDTDADITAGLALKGFILRAHELGLGTCILTAPLTFAPELESLAEPEPVRIRCFVAAGFPDEEPALTSRRPIAEIYRTL